MKTTILILGSLILPWSVANSTPDCNRNVHRIAKEMNARLSKDECKKVEEITSHFIKNDPTSIGSLLIERLKERNEVREDLPPLKRLIENQLHEELIDGILDAKRVKIKGLIAKDFEIDTDNDIINENKEENVGYPPHPRRTVDYDQVIAKTERFSASVKLAIFGAELGGGPTITFARRYVINTKIIGGGDEPVIKKDDRGVRHLNHRSDRRLVFLCTATSQASHKLGVGATLSFMGAGGTVDRERWDQLVVQQTSELARVPFTNKDGSRTNFGDLKNFCVNRFYPEVKATLDKEIKLAAKELTYSHRDNQCGSDAHCGEWHRSLLPGVTAWTNARCLQVNREEPVMLCRLRSKKDGACSYYINGERVTSGFFEYPCDSGLKCTVTKEGGWFTNWSIYSDYEARCK